MNDEWTEQFARFEALLSRGNVFSTPKTAVPPVSHPVLSDKPFLISFAQPTGPVVYLAEQEVHVKTSETKTKKKSHKSAKGEKVKHVTENPAPAADIPGSGDDLQEPIFQPVPSQERISTGSSEQFMSPSTQTGQGPKDNGHSGIRMEHFSTGPCFL